MSAAERPRWTMDELFSLARSGVQKVDLLGQRGTTLCSMDEVEAMAIVIAYSRVLDTPPPPQTETET